MQPEGRTFRIFLSSTFTDFKEERNALQNIVFPRLEELCLQHNCRFLAIDLRWGIREEASLDHKTIQLCRAEIHRCQKISPRPNFIVLLGDRYGWRPLPSSILRDEYEKLLSHVSTPENRKLLESWYLRDDNAVPPVHYLKPRTIQIEKSASTSEKDAETEKEAQEWNAIESELRDCLISAADSVPLSPDQMFKYEASATEQEIAEGILNIEDAKDHVFCFLRKINGLPNDSTAKEYQDMDSEKAEKQARLINIIKESLTDNVFEYQSDWLGSGISLDHIKIFCEDVYANLSRIILAEIKHLGKIDPHKQEVEKHDAFIKANTIFFTGRDRIIRAIDYYIMDFYSDDAEPHPLAIFGVPGSGKSATMSMVVEQTRKNCPHAWIIPRFIGVTPDSSDIRSLLESLCRQVSECYGADESKIPPEYNDLVKEFPKKLALATKRNPLVILLDALDQLSEKNDAKNLLWLPNLLPKYVRLVVTTGSEQCWQILWNRIPDREREWRLKELPPMSLEEGQKILGLWFENAHRTLQPEQKKEILDKFHRCPLPLYLKLAFEQASNWTSQTKGIELSSDIPGVIDELLARLSADSNHGHLMVSRSLGYLAASKNGLSENEMLDILSKDKDVFEDIQERAHHELSENRLPAIFWSRLYYGLESYLSSFSEGGTPLISFFHRQLHERINLTYLKPNEKMERHRSLALYFEKQPLEFESEVQKTFNTRKLSEMVYQESIGQLRENLRTNLTDYAYLDAKIRAFSPQALIEDFNLARKAEQNDSSLDSLQDAIRLSSHVISQDADQLAGQLIGRLIWNDDLRVQTLLGEAQKSAKTPWLRPLTPCLDRPGKSLLRTLTGLDSAVNAVTLTPDGKRIVAAANDGTIKMWDGKSGNQLATFLGHSQEVNDLLVTPDGNCIVSASSDCTVKIWGVKSGELLATLEGHTSRVNGIAILFQGKIVLSISDDQTIKFWDLNTAIAQNEAHLRSSLEDNRILLESGSTEARLKAVATTPDERTAILAAADHTIRIMDLENHEILHVLPGHRKTISSVTTTQDGKLAVSASLDGTIKVWDILSGIEEQNLEVQGWAVLTVSVTPDGKHLISGHYDGSLIIWDLETGRKVVKLEGNRSPCLSTAVSPDGATVVSGYEDHMLKVWNLKAEHETKSQTGHDSIIKKVVMSPDGKLAVSCAVDGTAKTWDPKSSEENYSWGDSEHQVQDVALLHEGQHIVTVFSKGNLKVWNAATGTETEDDIKYFIAGDTIEFIAVAETGEHIMFCERDHKLRLWNSRKRKKIFTLDKSGDMTTTVSFMTDGSGAVSGTADGKLKIWSLVKRNMVKEFQAHTGRITGISVAADCRRILSADQEGILKMWDLNSENEIPAWEAHSFPISGIAINNDRKYAFSCSLDGKIRVWNLDEGKCVTEFTGEDSLETIAVSKDGKTVVVGGNAGLVHSFRLEY